MLLFLNSIAGSELIVVLLFVLIFFGAKSIPGVARNLGRGIRQVKDASQSIQDEIKKSGTEMKREMNVNRAIENAKSDIEKPIKDFSEDIKSSSHEINNNVEKITKSPDNYQDHNKVSQSSKKESSKKVESHDEGSSTDQEKNRS